MAALAFAAGPAGAASRLGIDAAPGDPRHELPTVPLLTYRADASEIPHVVLTRTATDLVVTAVSAQAWDVQPPCLAESATVARCPLDAVASGFVLATVTGTPRPMVLETAADVPVPVYALGNPGQADQLQGGAAADILRVGDGGTADGGPGSDHLSGPADGHAGTLLGGDGDDRLDNGGDVQGGPGNDQIITALTADGGPGDDVIYRTQHALGGDGADAVNGAAYGGPEVVEGGPGPDTLTGSGASAVLHGGPGDDALWECSMVCAAGAMNLYGDDGADRLYGASLGATMDGGTGDDQLAVSGGPTGGASLVNPDGSITSTGRGFPFPGNAVQGGPGNDAVTAAQGIADRIDCGEGADTASRDALDAVSGCESGTIVASAPSPYFDPYKDPYQDPYADPLKAKAAALAFTGAQRLRVSAKGAARIALRCAAKTACAGRLRLTSGRTVLGQAACRVKGTRSVSVPLARKAMKRLRRRGRLTARLTFVPSAKGATAPKPRTLTLIAPRRR
jgi:hypothetical protein